MSRSGRIVLVVVGAVAVVVGATLAATRPWAATPADQHGFVHYANAIDTSGSAIMIGLVPSGQCAIGLGQSEADAIVPTYWTSGGACHRFAKTSMVDGGQNPDAGPDSSQPGGTYLVGAVAAGDGSLTVIGEDQEHNDYLAGSGEIFSLTASGLNLVNQVDSPQNAGQSWQDENGQVFFASITLVGTKLLIGGKQSTPSSEGRPTVWSSDDGGGTLDAAELPEPANLVAGVDAMAVHGDTVLALGTETADERNDTLVGWESGDQGRTWARIAQQSYPAHAISGIVFTNGQWIAAGETQGARMPEPIVLTSSDAQHWQPTSLPAPEGGGEVTGLTVDRTGSPIAVGWTGSPADQDDKNRCGEIWLATPPATWTDTATGCGGATRAEAVTLADGRVLVVNGHDLWIRS
ncbi:MAG TPA: hypothetical protein VJ914_32760 [Pseudonocardiaceae bacterium]|nr:hypothetical protein [Pseudonocardiaceae bacterium]